MQFLQDEFVNIAQTDAFSFMPKTYLAEALKSDFLQVFDILLIIENEVEMISIITNIALKSTLTLIIEKLFIHWLPIIW